MSNWVTVSWWVQFVQGPILPWAPNMHRTMRSTTPGSEWEDVILLSPVETGGSCGWTSFIYLLYCIFLAGSWADRSVWRGILPPHNEVLSNLMLLLGNGISSSNSGGASVLSEAESLSNSCLEVWSSLEFPFKFSKRINIQESVDIKSKWK